MSTKPEELNKKIADNSNDPEIVSFVSRLEKKYKNRPKKSLSIMNRGPLSISEAEYSPKADEVLRLVKADNNNVDLRMSQGYVPRRDDDGNLIIKNSKDGAPHILMGIDKDIYEERQKEKSKLTNSASDRQIDNQTKDGILVREHNKTIENL